MDFISFLKDWIIPFSSVFLSVWFAASAKKDSEKAQQTLEQIDRAIQGWQKEIMSSAVNILNTMPQVISGKEKLSRTQATEAALTILQNQFSENISVAEKIELIKQIGKNFSANAAGIRDDN